MSKVDIVLLLVTVLAIVSTLVLATLGNLQVGNMAHTGAYDDPGSAGPRSTSEDPTDPPEDSGIGAPPAERLQLQDTSYSGEAFEAVPIKGTYVGADAGITLRVQRRQDGEWVSFPVPAVTNDDGSFRAFVQLGAGRYRLRITDPESDVVSDEIVLRIG